MARIAKSMDGNNAAAYVSYAFTEVAGIYPITPSSPMADYVDQWSAKGMKNIFGTTVKVAEMQSEAGAAGTVHGSLAAGALTTTYTASQGLLLMIPNMYKIAGELLPAVFHVSARCVASHALNIFGDHSDVYACRQTGFAMLAETNPQEVMDLGAVAHLAAIKGRVPFINFFDGFRTSHEIQKIEVWDYEDLKEMCDMDAVEAFRKRALNPEHPVMRGSHENGDIFFQHREACNKYYDAIPGIVEEYMDKVNAKLGTDYKPFNYYGAPDADRVIVAMGSICDVAEEVIDYLTAKGEKVGLVKVRLYRPFSADRLVAAIPATAKKIAVLDRTKEPGALGEPLYLDVVTALATTGRDRKGLSAAVTASVPRTLRLQACSLFMTSSRRTSPRTSSLSASTMMLPTCPSRRRKLPTPQLPAPSSASSGVSAATAQSARTRTPSRSSATTPTSTFRLTSSMTRRRRAVSPSPTFVSATSPIKSPYYINKADFVACHNPSYVEKGYKMVNDVKPGGVFLINCQWDADELNEKMPAEAKRYIAKNNIQLYTVNAIDIAAKIGLGKRTNTVLQSAFFSLAKILPEEEAIGYMKEKAQKFMKKGKEIVEMNEKAIDAGATAFVKIDVPADWADAVDAPKAVSENGPEKLVKMVDSIMRPVGLMNGDSLPVSVFVDHADGTFEQGASAYEKRGVAVMVPEWNAETCAQCNQCSFVCPHATIRPYLLTEEEAANAPEGAAIVDKKAGKGKGVYKYTLAVSPARLHGLRRLRRRLPDQFAQDGLP